MTCSLRTLLIVIAIPIGEHFRKHAVSLFVYTVISIGVESLCTSLVYDSEDDECDEPAFAYDTDQDL